jgi:hypothetical protein
MRCFSFFTDLLLFAPFEWLLGSFKGFYQCENRTIVACFAHCSILPEAIATVGVMLLLCSLQDPRNGTQRWYLDEFVVYPQSLFGLPISNSTSST